MDFGGDLPSGSGAMIPGVRALVETVLLSARDGQLCFRTVTRPLGDGEHPDACARSLAGPDVGLLHSTSWRYTGGGIVLTYAGLPDADPVAAVEPVPDLPAVHSGDPLAPSPPVVRPVDVAAHACRHLAFLRHTDPHVAVLAAGGGEVWDLIDVFTPAVAGMFPIQVR
ncbi:DOMON domain-containing protein [Phytohabitans aurantiacus]|uniref:Uncharacterized protein n=1 Tax=Phytohabitans aurantiacus TaxID=3016789 RepID=A0ABQ5R4M2_9ACTN|nr:hypothetical protein [Phytohabitans aurantiacus]GLI01744.1 hypothetical protein Pa4123_70200 [Phytohabitans aurantiacus]